MNVDALRAELGKYNQEHLLRFWNDLSESERVALVRDISELDLSEVTSYFSKAWNSHSCDRGQLDDKLHPIASGAAGSALSSSPEDLRDYEALGLREIAEGRAAVLLMAGGQGTRLGVTYPKGMYDVGLPSHKTLFQLQAERILRLQTMAEQKYGKRGEITWYIMTSEATQTFTLEYLRENDFFGLKEENVRTFEQGMLPCYSFDGKIILDERHRISRAPDGNGGLYRAIRVQGILEDMAKRGIRSVHVHSVDNILVRVADPAFLGYCISRSADCGAKVVEKSSPDEAVGVVCQVNGEYRVVEYSEISEETANRRRADGRLLFNAGNICNHYFTVEFLERVASTHEAKLDLHIAKKKIPYVNDSGVRSTPDSPNGIKVEKFVFDVFRFSKNFVTWEVERKSEFSALKKPDSAGEDCASTARRGVLAMHKKWLLNAGAISVEGDVEVSPLVSYAGENLTAIARGKSFQGPVVL